MSILNTYVQGGAMFFPPESPAIPKVRKLLRFPNPEYAQYLRLRERGKFIPKPTEYMYACRDIPQPHPWAGGLAAPRYIDVGEILPHGEKVERMTSPRAPLVRLAPGFKPRDYQEKAVELMLKFGSGHVVSPPGSGKTSIGMVAISKHATKALVIVHTKVLANQWADRCRKQLMDPFGQPVEPSIIGDGKFDDTGRVVIATYQSLHKIPFMKRYEWSKQFGLTIGDEIHVVGAHTFSDVMMSMAGRYRLGLTATPEREDGLTPLIWYHMGPKLLAVSLQDLEERGLVMLPRIERLSTGWSFDNDGDDNPDWQKTVNAMCGNNGRNAKLLARVAQAVKMGRQVLVLSPRVAHCELLANALRSMGMKASALVGKMSKTKRAETLALADERKLDVVTATQLADEGLDLPRLDTVVLAVPTKALGRIQQRIGRTMRPAPGKLHPLVIDAVDQDGAFEGLWKKRKKLYEKLGCRL